MPGRYAEGFCTDENMFSIHNCIQDPLLLDVAQGKMMMGIMEAVQSLSD